MESFRASENLRGVGEISLREEEMPERWRAHVRDI